MNVPKFKPLKGDIKTDVLIIGGGIAGILTAYFLEKSGVPYVLAEKGSILCGNTRNTTAKITVQHGFIYDKLLKTKGLETAKAYYEANAAALSSFADLCRGIDCDYEEKENFVYTLDDTKAAERELRAIEKAGGSPAFHSKLTIPVKIAAAVSVPKQAQFNPLKFLYSISEGLNIRENTFVRELEGCTAVTDGGKINAKRIIAATHFPLLNKHGSYFIKLYQHRSYALALENAADVGGMYVDESDNRDVISQLSKVSYCRRRGSPHRKAGRMLERTRGLL